ncbi:MAG: type I restriction enzyme HsdR N-terminal domain-containing protein [Flavobacteriales bacterium]|nr:type I restriction enzyme HsdR N-terminal domain-containing protein [Flavobacteriales bacterium]
MQALNLPEYEIRIKQENGKQLIFDAVRKKYLILTPEEWVRQNFVQYLIRDKHYPAGLIQIEKGLKLNELQKRADAVIYKGSRPHVLLECKAPHIPINQDTFEQIARYNSVFKVPYLIVTNGMDHYCACIDFEQNSFEFLKEIPDYKDLSQDTASD